MTKYPEVVKHLKKEKNFIREISKLTVVSEDSGYYGRIEIIVIFVIMISRRDSCDGVTP